MKTIRSQYALLTIALASLTTTRVQDVLPSWNDGKAKQSIVDFVAKVTKEGSPDFVPPAERIATFDNDGTLWAEQSMYFQILFALHRVGVLAPQHPEWKDKEPFASPLKGEAKSALAGGERAMLEIVMVTHAGMTTEEFERIVKDWVATAKHPVTKRLYTEMVYQPMLEMLAYLRANGFKTFIVSGGGTRLMALCKTTTLRESSRMAPSQKIGTFSNALMTGAEQKRWTVISMKSDWKRVCKFKQYAISATIR